MDTHKDSASRTGEGEGGEIKDTSGIIILMLIAASVLFLVLMLSCAPLRANSLQDQLDEIEQGQREQEDWAALDRINENARRLYDWRQCAEYVNEINRETGLNISVYYDLIRLQHMKDPQRF